MNIFELACASSPIIGAIIGVKHHTALGVSHMLGGFIGAVSGMVAFFTLVCTMALIFKMTFGGSLFKSKKELR